MTIPITTSHTTERIAVEVDKRSGMEYELY